MPRRPSKPKSPVTPASSITANVRQSPICPPHQGRNFTNKRTSKHVRKLSAVPRYNNLIWTIDDFFTTAECTAWLSYLSTTPFTTSLQRATAYTAFRENGRKELWSESVAQAIWARLCPLLPDDISDGAADGCYEKIRLYEYVVGQRFGKHIDEAEPVSDGLTTGATVLIYLNDDGLEGGETVFYDGRRDDNIAFSFRPKRGSLLIHGCVKHNARFYQLPRLNPYLSHCDSHVLMPVFLLFFCSLSVCSYYFHPLVLFRITI